MRDEFIERHIDILQNIESAIFDVYEDVPALLDLDVIDALDALVRRYAAEEQNRTPPTLRLSRPAKGVYDAVERTCEWRLGRASLGDGEGQQALDPPSALMDITACLKRIRKSAHTWNEQGGRQGYLDYITDFFRQMDRHLRRPGS